MAEFNDYNHSLIMLAVSTLAVLFALASCTPDNNNGESGENQNNQEELAITGELLDVTEYTATLTGYANLPFELGDAEVGIMYDNNQSFESSNKAVATELDENNMFTVTVAYLSPSTTYYYKSYVQNGKVIKYGAVKSFSTKEPKCPVGAVDLGIVITRKDGTTYNLYWAKSNLSSNGLCANETDFGDYYAWGETESKNEYSWSTYIFGSYPEPFSKYVIHSSFGTVDQKTVLDPEDDAAHTILGGNWRMPTVVEWETLLTLDGGMTTLNGVEGWMADSDNGQSIFLPFAGFWLNSDYYDAESGGAYWSSSLSTAGTNTDTDAYSFYSDARGDGRISPYFYRYSGLSIRPVFPVSE